MAVSRTALASLVALACMGAANSYAGFTPRIINGSTATTGLYPFIASISVDSVDGLSVSGCGGSLIDSEWIVTAAHCFLNDAGDAVDSSSGTRTTVTLASDTLDPVSRNAEVLSVTQLIIHPNYNPNEGTSANTNDFDMALLRLSSPSNQAVIKLQAQNDPVADATPAIIMGWGTTGVDSDNVSINPSNTLLESTQQIVSNASCSDAYGDSITSNMICASAPAQSATNDTCQGDSGGPLIVNDNGTLVQVGVVSFGGTEAGPVCGDPNAPGVYTRVSQFNAFIQQHIQGIEFATIGGSGSSNCAGTTIDESSLNLSIACVVLDGTVFSTNLNMVGPGLLWEWSGEINETSCSASDSRCVAPDADLGLIMTGIPYLGESNSLILKLDQSGGDALRWSYHEHFVEQ